MVVVVVVAFVMDDTDVMVVGIAVVNVVVVVDVAVVVVAAVVAAVELVVEVGAGVVGVVVVGLETPSSVRSLSSAFVADIVVIGDIAAEAMRVHAKFLT